MTNSKPVGAPIGKWHALSLTDCLKTDEEENRMRKVPYSNTISNLMYTILCTRPDISFAIGTFSQFEATQDLFISKQ